MLPGRLWFGGVSLASFNYGSGQTGQAEPTYQQAGDQTANKDKDMHSSDLA